MDKMKEKDTNFFEVWNDASNNLFHMRIADGLAYMLLYMVVPIAVTFFNFVFLKESDAVSVAYFYFTLLFNAAGCLYDIYGRWDTNEKTRRNTKLLMILVPSTLVFLYSFVEMAGALISNQRLNRPDGILYMYFVAFIITFWDFILCLCNMAITKGFIVGFKKGEK